MPHENKWQGRAIVIRQGKKVVIVKHGNIIRSAHPCNLQLKTPEEIIVGKENEIGSKATFFEYKTLNQQNITIPTNKSENNDDE